MTERILMNSMKTFAEKLDQELTARDWSPNDLAKRVGVSKNTARRWRIGEAKPDIEQARVLADLFDVDLDYLARDEREEKKLKNGLTEWDAKILSYARDLERVLPGEVELRLLKVDLLELGREGQKPR